MISFKGCKGSEYAFLKKENIQMMRKYMRGAQFPHYRGDVYQRSQQRPYHLCQNDCKLKRQKYLLWGGEEKKTDFTGVSYSGH